MSEENVQEFVLKEDCELRFAAGDDSDVCLELVKGYAEIFGTELLLNKKYTFPASKFSSKSGFFFNFSKTPVFWLYLLLFLRFFSVIFRLKHCFPNVSAEKAQISVKLSTFRSISKF